MQINIVVYKSKTHSIKKDTWLGKGVGVGGSKHSLTFWKISKNTLLNHCAEQPLSEGLSHSLSPFWPLSLLYKVWYLILFFLNLKWFSWVSWETLLSRVWLVQFQKQIRGLRTQPDSTSSQITLTILKLTLKPNNTMRKQVVKSSNLIA